MDIGDEEIRQTVSATEILRPPRQNLATFGVTNIYYYLVTQPAYQEPEAEGETVIREGRVIAERPRIVTPYYLTRLEGFSPDAGRYFEDLIKDYGRDAPGLLYRYKNEPKELNIVSDSLPAVVARLNAEIDRRADRLASIIKGTDFLWDVSLLKFIYELTRNSVRDNVTQLGRRGLLDVDEGGVPAEARLRIEGLFRLVVDGEMEPRTLKEELDRWNLFGQYEDRFLALFRRGG
jgi:hypothetical protein